MDQNYATRQYVDDNAKNLVEEVCQRSDTREELGRLWKDFDAECERVRQTVRLQQAARKDLNDVIDDVQALRNEAGTLSTRCDTLNTSINQVEALEKQHWETAQEALRTRKQAHEDLEVFHKALRDEFVTNKELQMTEAERMKSHSTMCYMEQIDKALNLSESVEKVVRQNRELSDSMQSIKLPSL